jgi:hypothetical protein
MAQEENKERFEDALVLFERLDTSPCAWESFVTAFSRKILEM